MQDPYFWRILQGGVAYFKGWLSRRQQRPGLWTLADGDNKDDDDNNKYDDNDNKHYYMMMIIMTKMMMITTNIMMIMTNMMMITTNMMMMIMSLHPGSLPVVFLLKSAAPPHIMFCNMYFFAIFFLHHLISCFAIFPQNYTIDITVCFCVLYLEFFYCNAIKKRYIWSGELETFWFSEKPLKHVKKIARNRYIYTNWSIPMSQDILVLSRVLCIKR